MSDDPQTRSLLTAALAERRVWALLTSLDDTELSGDVIIELPNDDGLGTLLNELHMISPRVFVSSADKSPQSVGRRRSAAPATPVVR
jgi:hypothetical protein